MVRTRDTVGVKAAGAKATRKLPASQLAGPSTSGSDSRNRYTGGNPYCPRDIPAWQKPITEFFIPKPKNGKMGESSSAFGTGIASDGASSTATQQKEAATDNEGSST